MAHQSRDSSFGRLAFWTILFLLAIGFSLLPAYPQADEGTQTSKSGSDGWSYVGSEKCKKCHMKLFKSWSATKMAMSFDLLKPGVRGEQKKKAGLDPSKDYSGDPECLPCHTTGYGKKGGFTSIKDTPSMAGVGCEMCHGVGEGYLREGFMTLKNKEFKHSDLIAAGLVVPDAKTCTTLCHNEKNPFHKEFKWEERKTQGIHEHIPLQYKHD